MQFIRVVEVIPSDGSPEPSAEVCDYTQGWWRDWMLTASNSPNKWQCICCQRHTRQPWFDGWRVGQDRDACAGYVILCPDCVNRSSRDSTPEGWDVCRPGQIFPFRVCGEFAGIR